MKAKNRQDFKDQWNLHISELNRLMWNFDSAKYPDIYKSMQLMLEEAKQRMYHVIEEASLQAFPSAPEDAKIDLEVHLAEGEARQAEFEYEDATECLAEGIAFTPEEIQADYEAEEHYHATENYARAHYTI